MAIDGRVTLQNVRIIFRNFEGKEGKYNRKGDRSFSVLLEPDLAKAMQGDGWNVKWLTNRDTGEPGDAHLEIAVSYKNRPPRVVMITSRGRTNLTEDEVEILDTLDISFSDLIINPYHWTITDKNGTETGVKAYLSSIYVTVNEDELELKYNDLENLNNLPTRSGRVDDGD